MTSPAGATEAVDFVATGTITSVSFDVDGDGTVDQTLTFTNGTAESDTFTVNGIAYTVSAESDTYTATSTQGVANSATSVVTAIGQESVSAGAVDIADRAYSGTASAEFTVDNDPNGSHKLTINFTSGAITTVTDDYNNTTTTLTGENGTYAIGTNGLAVTIADGALSDGTLINSEITVTTTWNNASEAKVSDTTSEDMSDSIRVSSNAAGNLITYKLDDTHYYAFVVDEKGKLVDFNSANYDATTTIGGIEFTESAPIAFGTSADALAAVTSSVSGTTFTISTGDGTAIGTATVKYSSGSNALTITPGSDGKFVAAGEEVATITFTTSDDKTYDGAQIVGSGSANYKGKSGAFGLTFTTPTYEDGVSSKAENYAINFSNITGYSSSKTAIGNNTAAAAYWTGAISVTAGTSTVSFGTKDLTAWLGLVGSTDVVGSNTAATYYNADISSAANSFVFALGTDSLIYKKSNDDKTWYKVSATFTTSGGSDGKQTVYTFSTSGNSYVGARLEYTNNTLTYYSTSKLGTGVTADDKKVTWTLSTGGGIEVTSAMFYDANNSANSDIVSKELGSAAQSTYGDKVDGTLDTYTLAKSTNTAWKATSSKDLTSLYNLLNKVSTLGKAGAAEGTAVSGNIIDMSAIALADNASVSAAATQLGTGIYASDTTKSFLAATSAATLGGFKLQDPNSEGVYPMDTDFSILLGSDGRVTGGRMANSLTVSNSTVTLTTTALSNMPTGWYSVGLTGTVTMKGSGTSASTNTVTLAFNSSGNEAVIFGQFATGTTLSDSVSMTLISDTGLFKAVSDGYQINAGAWINGLDFVGATKTTLSQALSLDSNAATSTKLGTSTFISSWLGSNASALKTAFVSDMSSGTKMSSATLEGAFTWHVGDTDGASLNAQFTSSAMSTLGTAGAASELSLFGATSIYWGSQNKSGYNDTTGDSDGVVVKASNGTVYSYNTETGSIISFGTANFDAVKAMAAVDAFSGVTKVYTGLHLGTNDTVSYALGVDNDGKALVEAFDYDGESKTDYSYVGSAVSGVISDISVVTSGTPTFGLLYSSDVSKGLVATSGTGVVTLSANGLSGLGQLDHINVTLSGGKVNSVGYFDSGDEALTGYNLVYGEAGAKGNTVGSAASSTYWAAIQGADEFSIVTTSDTGITAGVLSGLTETYTDLLGDEETFAVGSTAVSGTVVASSLTDENLSAQAGAAKNFNVAGTLAGVTIPSGSRIIQINLGSGKFYLVTDATVDKTAEDDNDIDLSKGTYNKLYNAAGVEVDSSDKSQGLYLSSNTLYVNNGSGTGAAAVLSYGTTNGYKLTVSSGADAISTKVGFDVTEGFIDNGTNAQSVFIAAELIGSTDDYATLGTNAKNAVSADNLTEKVTATYLTTQFTSADYAAALAGGSAGLTYTVTTADGGYTGMVALGFSNAGSDNANTALVDNSGTTVPELYATYTFGSDKSFKVTGLYSDQNATTAYTDAVASETSITFGSGDTAVTYTLSASSYSDVTVSLSSGTITYDNTAINMTIGDGTADTSATTALAFRTALDSDTTAGFQFEFTGTEITKVSATTYVNDTSTTVAETPLATSNTWSDSTKTYTAVWNDVNGNGTVDSNDTVTLTETPNAVTYELSAEVSLNVASTSTDTTSTDTNTTNVAAYTEKFAEEDVEGTTLTTTDSSSTNYVLKASDTTTVHVFDASGNEVTTDLGYTFAIVDADSNGAISDGDYFTYTSKNGDTVSGSVVSESATGTIDALSVTRTYDGTAYTYVDASGTTITSLTAEDGTIYTLASDGTITKQSGSETTTVLTLTNVDSDKQKES